MTFSDLPQPTETPPAGPFGVPSEYFGPPDGETALRADEMHATRVETEAMSALRIALHHPETGFASRPPTERLAALPELQATLDGIGETFRAQATTPRQQAILGPLLDNHLEHAATQVGRLAEQALAEADDGTVETRIGNLQQDAAVNWDDPARLRILARAVVTERRSQGERKGWDKAETETRVRHNVSDFYATAIEAATDRDLDRAGKLLTDAQGVLLPDGQSMLARKLAEAREDRHVAGIAGTLAAIPLDPATAPNAEAYRARAEELTPDDATPELRARIAQLTDTAQRHATKYWQHDRNQAGLAAIDWMVSHPGAPVVTMDRKVTAQLSPEQLVRLLEIETTGRLDTDPAVYDKLDRLAVYDPKTFAATDLSHYRLALDGKDYARFIGFQKGDATFARYDRGRTVLDTGLIKAQLDPDGPEARAARGELDKTLRSFEAIEGRPPAMADIDRIADKIAAFTAVFGVPVDPSLSPAKEGRDSNIVLAQAATESSRAGQHSPQDTVPVKNFHGAPHTEPYPGSSDYQAAQERADQLTARGMSVSTEPTPGSQEYLKAKDEADKLIFGRGTSVNTEPTPGSLDYQRAEEQAHRIAVGYVVFLPDGSRIADDRSPTGYVMAPESTLAEVARNGRWAGMQLKAGDNRVLSGLLNIFLNVGTGGNFDYQREGNLIQHWFTGPKFEQRRHFLPIANINVGLLCQQAGWSLEETLRTAGKYAKRFSENNKPNEPDGLDPRTARYITEGYRIGGTGMFGSPDDSALKSITRMQPNN